MMETVRNRFTHDTTEYVEEINWLYGEMIDRMIIVFILSVYGYVQVYLLSNTGLANSATTTINSAYTMVGAALYIYTARPFFTLGVKYADDGFGKLFLGVVVVIAVALGVKLL